MRATHFRLLPGFALAFLCALTATAHGQSTADPNPAEINGYLGIHYNLGQANAYGSKYSGGLATYPANMFPIASYAAKVNKTFFVYGGTTADDQRDLQIMVSYFDHNTGKVPLPTRVRDSKGFTDAHANPSIAIDSVGHIWVFSATRGKFEGRRYRSTRPYDLSAFDQIDSQTMAYPQPWYADDAGFLFLFTQYTAGRELYFQTSANGEVWSPAQKIAGFGGHYQNSMQRGTLVGTAFNYHPRGNLDQRTNLYYLQTADRGQTWTNVSGTPLATPLNHRENPALVIDYEAAHRLVYIHDTNLDTNGHPAILYLTSAHFAAGPGGDPRTWHVTHWNGTTWSTSDLTTSTSNYDVGCLHLEEDGTWRVIGPTETGPQPHGTGGEMAMWTSANQGITWKKVADLTHASVRNHTYARRPVPAHPDFYAFWADGDTENFSEVNLYFCNQSGSVFRLPRHMPSPFHAPEQIR